MSTRTTNPLDVVVTGLPVGVQIASLWWREDVCLALMRHLEKYFKSQPDYPLSRSPE